jgi:PAS domain S-box-containing protein
MIKKFLNSLFRNRSIKSIVWLAFGVVVLISLLDLLGWYYHIPFLKSLSEQRVPMKPIVAVGFIFTVISLVISNIPSLRPFKRITSYAASFVICIPALITLCVYGLSMITGSDPAFCSRPVFRLFLSYETRMAVVTSALMLIFGILILLLAAKSPKTGLVHALLVPIVIFAYVIPLGYILGVPSITTLLDIRVALNTGISFCILSFAVLCLYPDTWLMHVFTSPYSGSEMARKLLIGFLILPIIIGYIRIAGERKAIFTSDAGVVLVAVTYTFCLIWLAWLTARSVNLSDAKRRRSEEKLRQNEQRLKYHIVNSPLAVVEWNENFIVTQWSTEAERMFGWKSEEVLGKPINDLNLIVEEDIPLVEQTMSRLVSGKEFTVTSTNRNYTRSGAIIECTWYNSVLIDENGQMSSVLSLVQDITERRIAERQLLLSRERYRALVEISPYAVFVNRNNKIVYVNPAAMDLFGASDPRALLGKTPYDLFHPDSHEIVKKRIGRLKQGFGVPLNEEKIVRLDGTVREVEVAASAYTDQEGKAIQVILHDITANKKALAIMYRYELITRYARDPLLLLNLDGKILEANQAAETFYGYSREDLLELRIPDIRADGTALAERQMQGARDHGILFETYHKIKNGTVVPVEVSSRGVMVDGQEMILSVVRDITERKKKEIELLKLNQTLKALDRCSQVMLRVNDESSFLREVCQIIMEDCHYTMVWIGYALEDEDKTVLPMAHCGLDAGYLETLHITWADTERGRGPTGTAIRTGQVIKCENMLTDPQFSPWREQAAKRGYAASISLPLIANNKTLGALTIYSPDTNPFSDKEVELLVEMANDLAYGITAIRWKIAQARSEMKLKKYAADLKELNATKDKFFSIIAHDLRNPFASILGTSEILSENPEQYDQATIRKFSKLMHQAAKSGFAILENLLEWSRSQTGNLSFNPQKLIVRDIISQNLNNVAVMAANKNISLQTVVNGNEEIFADANMMHTILRNLLTNAIKFTPPGGKVTVYSKQTGLETLFTVKDNGIGIAEKDVDKLFRIDVKFSNIGTAEERGTGLGLLLCREFVEKHGGKIWLESKPGKGSSFKFSIPVKPQVPFHKTSSLQTTLPED